MEKTFRHSSSLLVFLLLTLIALLSVTKVNRGFAMQSMETSYHLTEDDKCTKDNINQCSLHTRGKTFARKMINY